jgi:hypothetical protein
MELLSLFLFLLRPAPSRRAQVIGAPPLARSGPAESPGGAAWGVSPGLFRRGVTFGVGVSLLVAFSAAGSNRAAANPEASR